jgi:7-keto-8-aminopelargonate synthetase-like enzyme
VLLDERAHAALVDAAGQFGAIVRRFAHRDAVTLQAEVRKCGRGAKVMVLTDGMFSHDGSVAPMREYLRRLPASTWFLVDDAHGAGVLGQQGRGTLELEGVGRARVIQCVTLSKAFGVYGGAVLGSAALRKAILERSRAFMGCTPLPLPLANAALKSIEVLKRDKFARTRLLRNAAWLKGELRNAGFAVPDLPGPIVALHPKPSARANAMRRALLAAGIYPPYLRYGGVAAGYFRFVISSEHSQAQLRNLMRTLKRFGQIQR